MELETVKQPEVGRSELGVRAPKAGPEARPEVGRSELGTRNPL
jgi:hypothetical protein